MCLTKRIKPCKLCVGFSYLRHEMDEVEDKMENNKITEGEYLKKMDKIKTNYDFITEYHKKKGCSDCMDDVGDEILVQEFEWRGNQYFIGEGGFDGVRILFDIVAHNMVGHVSSAGAVILD